MAAAAAGIYAYSCGYCQYQTGRLNRYLNHLKFLHQEERGFTVTCGIDGCQRKYFIVDSLSRHIRRNHNQNICERPNDNDESDDGYMHVHHNDSDESDVHEQEGSDAENVEEENDYDYRRAIASFILKFREEQKLPENACAKIVKEIGKLNEISYTENRTAVGKVLAQNAIAPRDIDGFQDIFCSFETISAACKSLDSTKKLNDYIARNFDFIEPEEVILGEDDNKQKETYMYIPIKRQLQCLLKHDDIFAEVQGGHSSKDGYLRDFCDGDAYKNHPIFSLNETTLQIILYHDDFQVVNPLGNRVKKYKVSAFYFMLGNLPPKYRSKLSAIQTLILCRSALVKKYSYSVVLQRLIEDLRSLEIDGVYILNDEQEYTFLGSVSYVIADNLAAHSISGLVESFSAFRTCRFCMITKEQRQVIFSDREVCLRTKEAYSIQLNNVSRHPDLASVYGIKSDSALNRLEYFHCIWGCPSDIAHDLFEGFVNIVLQQLIRYFVQESFFTLSQLNHKIRTFKYAECDKATKPWPFAEELAKFKIKLTASQCWCFLRLFPLMVNEWIPRDEPYMLLLTDLLDIVDYICAHTIHPGELLSLQEMVSNFLQKYFTEFEEDDVTPKAHFLTHYAREMKHFGPLVNCQSLRCESKHCYYKEIASRTKNRKNLCMTLAYRHQYQQCLYHSSVNFFRDDIVEETKGCLFPVRLLPNEVQGQLIPLLGGKESVHQTDSVRVEGVKYCTGSCVVLQFDDEVQDTFVFGNISNIFVISGNAYLLTEVLETLAFRKDLHAYIVTKSGELQLRRVSDLLDFHPLGLYEFGEEYAVILKYKISY